MLYQWVGARRRALLLSRLTARFGKAGTHAQLPNGNATHKGTSNHLKYFHRSTPTRTFQTCNGCNSMWPIT